MQRDQMNIAAILLILSCSQSRQQGRYSQNAEKEAPAEKELIVHQEVNPKQLAVNKLLHQNPSEIARSPNISSLAFQHQDDSPTKTVMGIC